LRATIDTAEVILICEQISDPGNLGALIRTADWFGIRWILLGSGSVDEFNPKVVRSSAGSIFRVGIEHTSELEIRLKEMNQAGRKLFAAMLEGILRPEELPRNGMRGLVMGHERRGVDPNIAGICSDTVCIPKYGDAESLNLAVATGILLHRLV
jgi:TrmH family RNA methyltransferase